MINYDKEKKIDPLDLTDINILRNFLKQYRIYNKKKFGQNFLTCRETLEKIVELGEISRGDLVIEVGPGHGVLTRELLKNEAVVRAVEIDPSVIPALKASTREWKDYFSVENIHVLDFKNPSEPHKFIANIPYHLTSPILRKFLIDTPNRPSKMVMLAQKEVVEKICCKEEKNSLLSIMVKTFGTPTYALTVGAEKFYPAPKVDSAVLVIDTLPKPQISIPSKIYFEMLFAGFKSPRKKLKNVLMSGFLKTEKQIEAIFETLNIDKNCRAQNITIGQWEAMTKIFFAEYFEQLAKKNEV
jgi:16S rRNA (adenine1518-N6/adenine1519-N6)-dimethyltransferase